ncbi:MAG TPA: hypothetical protein PK637_17480, partial [Flavobacteriales bacterium]|nr:hypothetical protein [Flavobacteriales bacterium]
MKRKFRVAYEEQVELDLLSATSYYNHQQKGLGLRFYKEYLTRIKQIKPTHLNTSSSMLKFMPHL